MRLRFAAPTLIVVGVLTGSSALAAAPPKVEATESSSRGPADKKAAEADAAKGTKALAAKKYTEAADAFESAFGQFPNPKWLFSAASARQKNGDNAKAANDYARYLKEFPTGPQRSAAQKALGRLTPKLGQLVFDAKGATVISVDSEAIAPSLFGSYYVTPGNHAVEAKFAEGDARQSAVAFIGQVTNVVLVHPDPAPVVDRLRPTAPTETGTLPPPRHDRDKPLPPLAVYIGAGVTVVAGGLSIISGLDVLSQKKAFEADRTQENIDSGKSKQARTNVLLVVTGVAAVFTGVTAIWFVDWHKKNQLKAGVGVGSVSLGGTF